MAVQSKTKYHSYNEMMALHEKVSLLYCNKPNLMSTLFQIILERFPNEPQDFPPLSPSFKKAILFYKYDAEDPYASYTKWTRQLSREIDSFHREKNDFNVLYDFLIELCDIADISGNDIDTAFNFIFKKHEKKEILISTFLVVDYFASPISRTNPGLEPRVKRRLEVIEFISRLMEEVGFEEDISVTSAWEQMATAQLGYRLLPHEPQRLTASIDKIWRTYELLLLLVKASFEVGFSLNVQDYVDTGIIEEYEVLAAGVPLADIFASWENSVAIH